MKKFLALIVLLAAPCSKLQANPQGFADVVARISPSVVSISSVQKIKEKTMIAPKFPSGSPFEEFFKDFIDQSHQGEGKEKKATALGSGVIIDEKEGYIVTAAHVISDSEKVTVTLDDGVELEAKIIGKDKRRDIALLKVITDKKLPIATLGDSSKLRQGDWTIAIGNPHGLGNTATVGIVSARSRDLGGKSRGIEATEFIDDFIQTDAALNQGNSGGPLFNSVGEVVGINVTILSETGGSIGIGFAVPSNTVQKIVEQIKQYGHTREGKIGVEIQKVTAEIAESVGLGKPKGAMVTRVFPESPAEKGAMKVGDIIIKVRDKDVKDVRAARKLISESPIGVEIPIIVWRNKKEETLSISIEEIPESDKEPASPDAPKKPTDGVDVLGMKMQTLSAEHRKAFKIDDKVNGVIVLSVTKTKKPSDSDEPKEILKPGDIIISVEYQPISTPADIAEKIEEAQKQKKKNILFQISREGDTRFIALNIEKSKE